MIGRRRLLTILFVSTLLWSLGGCGDPGSTPPAVPASVQATSCTLDLATSTLTVVLDVESPFGVTAGSALSAAVQVVDAGFEDGQSGPVLATYARDPSTGSPTLAIVTVDGVPERITLDSPLFAVPAATTIRRDSVGAYRGASFEVSEATVTVDEVAARPSAAGFAFLVEPITREGWQVVGVENPALRWRGHVLQQTLRRGNPSQEWISQWSFLESGEALPEGWEENPTVLSVDGLLIQYPGRVTVDLKAC